MFDTKHPFVANDIHRRMGINQGPSTILQKSIEFFCHSVTPYIMFDNLIETSGFTGRETQGCSESSWQWILNRAISSNFGFVNVKPRSCGHRMSSRGTSRGGGRFEGGSGRVRYRRCRGSRDISRSSGKNMRGSGHIMWCRWNRSRKPEIRGKRSRRQQGKRCSRG
jgi:hypothetical protein